MRVALIGGTGFVGGYLIDALLAAGHQPRLLVRPGSESKVSHSARCELVAGSLSDDASIKKTVKDCDALIYNAGILREIPRQGATFEEIHYRGVVTSVDAAVGAAVPRVILMSANGIYPPQTPYQDSKCRAEEYLQQSGLDYTIFQPSVIFGDPRGKMEIATQLYQDMVSPPIPAVGFHTGIRPSAGAVMMSPVHVTDVVDAFVRCIDNPAAANKTYVLGGPEEVSWTTMLQRVAAAVNKQKIIVPMPIGLMQMAAALLDWIPAFPVTGDQLTMLAAGNTASDAELRTLIQREPLAFSPETLAYLRR